MSVGGELTGQSYTVILLPLQDVQERVGEPRLVLRLYPPRYVSIWVGSKAGARSDSDTYIFQVQFRLPSSIRIGVEGGLYAVPESCNIHLAPTTGPCARMSRTGSSCFSDTQREAEATCKLPEGTP